jgi:uncharacterized protein
LASSTFLSDNAQPFGQRYAVSDVCLLVESIERSVRFYVDRLGFTLRRRAPEFADFSGLGVTLALWEADRVRSDLDLPSPRAEGVHKTMLAVRLPAAEAVDDCYAELCARGVTFHAPPAD